MTMLGKLLVLAIVVISFLAFTWSAALYVNRIDYTDTAASADRPAGELVRRKEELKELDRTFGHAVAVVRDDRKALTALESGPAPDRGEGRPGERDWYEGQMDLVAFGGPEFAAKRTPQEITEGKKGPRKLDVKDAVGPDLSPLRPLTEIVRDERETLDKITEGQKTYRELTDRDRELTEEIIGTKDAEGKILTKGLRLRLSDEKVKLAEVKKEIDRVQPLLINAAVDAQLILERQKSLLKRIDSLREKFEGKDR